MHHLLGCWAAGNFKDGACVLRKVQGLKVSPYNFSRMSLNLGNSLESDSSLEKWSQCVLHMSSVKLVPDLIKLPHNKVVT